jgi:hypothetical protein
MRRYSNTRLWSDSTGCAMVTVFARIVPCYPNTGEKSSLSKGFLVSIDEAQTN